MTTRHHFIQSCKNAVISKKLALSFHLHTTDINQRRALCTDVCRKAGLPGSEMKGQLLEYLTYASRITTSEFGAWDSNETIAKRLGWRNRDQVKRAKLALIEAGLIETGLGIPKGQKAPHTHYRLTRRLGDMIKRLIVAVRATAHSYKRAKPPILKRASTGSSTKTLAHQEFKPNPGRKPATREVGGFHLGKIKALMKGGAAA